MGDPQIENLVFEGGGVRGCAFAGAIQCLEDMGRLKNIKRVAGSSAGALAATLIAINSDATKFKEILMGTDLSQFNDGNKGVLGFPANAFRFLWHYSWHKGDNLTKFIGDLLEKTTGNRDITFQQIYDKYGKELIITTTDVKHAHTLYFHYLSYPDFPVRIAVRASMAIPLYFKPIKFEDTLLVDGGLLNNYPIWIFDACQGEIFNDNNRDNNRDNNDDNNDIITAGRLPHHSADHFCTNIEEHTPNNKTLGLKLVGPDEKEDSQIFHGELDIHRIRHYILSLMDCMTWQIERSGIRPGYWERTVVIPTLGVKTTDFDVTEQRKLELYQSGYNAVTSYFNKLADSQEEIDLFNKPYFIPNLISYAKLNKKRRRKVKTKSSPV